MAGIDGGNESIEFSLVKYSWRSKNTVESLKLDIDMVWIVIISKRQSSPHIDYKWLIVAPKDVISILFIFF